MKSRHVWIIAALLFVGTIALYWRTTHFGFVDYDDPQYVTQNPIVQGGLTPGGIKWALFSGYASNWHPVTWMSHMVDCSVFGLKAGGHHLTNVLLHAANTTLVLLVLLKLLNIGKTPNTKHQAPEKHQDPASKRKTAKNVQMASDASDEPATCNLHPATFDTAPRFMLHASPGLWCAAIIAALFAVHPLHVESVAWISERKDVLSAFFFLLTIWAYARYAQGHEDVNAESAKTAEKRREGSVVGGEPLVQSSRFKVQGSGFFFWISIFLYALALMSKPMVVTLPFVLLLLDFWPLRRFQRSTMNNPLSTRVFELVQEKLPFFGMTIAGCALTVWAQRSEAMSTLAQVPLGNRISNAVVSYVVYLWKTVWPHPLAPLYPYREWAVWQVAGAACLLLAISWFVLMQLNRRPYLTVGWFWYLGTLVPVIGVVQVGIHSMADRYMYLPSIGLFLAIVFGAMDVCGAVGGRVLAAIALVALSLVTWHQLPVWNDSASLFSHVVGVTKNNLRAEYNLGVALQKDGRIDKAIVHYRNALSIKPTPLDVQAKTQAQAHLNLAIIFAEREDWANGADEFRSVLAEDTSSMQARAGLAGCLVGMKRYDDAVQECQAAINLNAGDAAVWRWMGVALADEGKGEEAYRAFQEAVRLNPDGPVELNELAWFWATYPNAGLRNGSGAVTLAQRACELTNWQEPHCVGTLDAAYAEAGNFAEAINTAHRAAELARSRGNMKLAAAAEERAKSYVEGKPWRQASRLP